MCIFVCFLKVVAARKILEETVRKWEFRRSYEITVENADTNEGYSLPEINFVRSTQICFKFASNKEFFNVVVSAIASPSKFWLQLVGESSIELEKLMTSLSNFYGNYINRKENRINKPKTGEIVAAFLPRNKKWYRAEIVGTKYKNGEELCKLFFLDYGNTEIVCSTFIFGLNARFKTLW